MAGSCLLRLGVHDSRSPCHFSAMDQECNFDHATRSERERERFVSFTPEESDLELKSQGLLLPSSFLETNRPRPFSSGATCAELSFNTCKAEDNLDAAHTHLAEARAQNAAMLEAKFKKPYPFILWNKFGSRS